MDPLLDFLLTITGLRIVLEALVFITLTLAGVGAVACSRSCGPRLNGSIQ